MSHRGVAEPLTVGALVCALLTIVAVGAPARTAALDEPLRVIRNTFSLTFAQEITFELQVESMHDLAKATLFYRREGEGITVRVEVTPSPGQERLTHTWGIEPGDLPVGERIEYEWLITDSQGNQVRTDPQSFEYADGRFDWKRLEQEGIILLYYGSTESEAERLLGHATQSLSRLQDEMGILLTEAVRIYVYSSKSDMGPALPRRSDAYDDRILTLGVVVDDATLLLLGTHSDVQGTIAHELSHIVVGLATDNPYTPLPRWLDEGLAMYSEGALPQANQRALQEAVRHDSLLSVRSLSGYTGNPSEVDLFYGEVYSVVEYLLTNYGKDRMSELLSVFTEGVTQETALQQTYGFGIDELDREWRASLGLPPRGAAATAPPTAQPPERPQTVPCPWAVVLGLMGVAAAGPGIKRARAA